MRNILLQADLAKEAVERGFSVDATTVYGLLVGILLIYAVSTTIYIMLLTKSIKQLLQSNIEANGALAAAIQNMVPDPETRRLREESMLHKLEVMLDQKLQTLKGAIKTH